MKLTPEDTIAAIATPPGEGAISIIRVSGPMAIQICDRVFVGSVKLADTPGYTIRHGTIRREDLSIVDEVLVSVFRAPRSFSGEDSVEVNCHGGMLVASEVLGTILEAGARQAEPGEFSKRAFLNGKIDLSKAEAIAGIISAQTRSALMSSVEHLKGGLQEKVDKIRHMLVDLSSLVELDLDFAEEGVSMLTADQILAKVSEVKGSIQELISAFEEGRILREGASVVITGKPNVGKSSLFNRILNNDRAIVSPLPGTTRDLLEENVTIGGVLFRFTDTAGIRDSVDVVESEGVARARARETSSDISISVFDGTEPVDGFLKKEVGERQIIAVNKLDIMDQSMRNKWANRLGQTGVLISAMTGEGLESLKKKLIASTGSRASRSEERVGASTLRQKEALAAGLVQIENAERLCQEHEGSELIAFELRECLTSLSEITGEVTTDEILNRVFGQFCIGK